MSTIRSGAGGSPLRAALGIITYNANRSLCRLLHHIRSSDAGAAERWVSDDGSTDGTAEMVKAAGIGSSSPNAGVATNRNRVLAWAMQAGFDAVVILDDDVEITKPDWWHHWITHRPDAELLMFSAGWEHSPGGEPAAISAHACRISRRYFQSLGFFDPAYDAGWGHEDEDYRDRGYRAGLTVAGYSYGISGGGTGRHSCLGTRRDNAAYYAALPQRPIYCPLCGHDPGGR